MRYQVIASVWVALNLMLDTQSTTEVTVEPDCQDDLEAFLTKAGDNNGAGAEMPEEKRSTTMTFVDGGARRLVFQMKERNTTIWTASALSKVLGHGTTGAESAPDLRSRVCAFKMLVDDPSMHYVLVTNAFVNADLKPFTTDRCPPAEHDLELPSPAVPSEFTNRAEVSRGRVHILSELSTFALEKWINELLVRKGNVPFHRAEECRNIIEDAFWSCMLPRHNRNFTTATLEAILQRYGARAALGPIPGYVAPHIARRAAEILQDQRCVVIVGPAGAGKASLADHLAGEFRLDGRRPESMPLKSIPDIPGALMMKGPALLVAKNLWGRGHGEEAVSSINLASELARAQRDKYVIVTCDSDRFASLPPDTRTRLKSNTIELTPASYSDDERWRIVINEAKRDGWQLASLTRFRRNALRDLPSPLSLSYFGLLVRDEAPRMLDPAEVRAIDASAWGDASFGFDEEIFGVEACYSDPNERLFDELVERALRETVGHRTAQILAAYPSDPVRHAALLLGLAIGYPDIDLARPTNIPTVEPRRWLIQRYLKNPAIEKLDMHAFMDYLYKTELIAKETDGRTYIPRSTRDALRDLVLSSPDRSRSVIMSVAIGLADQMKNQVYLQNTSAFSDPLEKIDKLLNYAYSGDPEENEELAYVSEKVETCLGYVFQHVTGRAFVRTIETAMSRRWGSAPLLELLDGLHPERLPGPLRMFGDAYGMLDTQSYFWHKTFNVMSRTDLDYIVRRLLVDFMPYTSLNYGGVSARFASFIRATEVVVAADVHNALNKLETFAMSQEGVSSELLQNKDPLLALLAAVSSQPYKSILPQPVPTWR